MKSRQRLRDERRVAEITAQAQALRARITQSARVKAHGLDAYGGAQGTPDRQYPGLRQYGPVFNEGEITFELLDPERVCQGPKRADHYDRCAARERDAAADRLPADLHRVRMGLSIPPRREGSYQCRTAKASEG